MSPIDGMPVGIKDIIETVDMPTEMGSPLFAGWRSEKDAAERARAARRRRVIIGKTVTTEFAAFRAARHAQSVEHRAHAGRLVERLGGSGRAPASSARRSAPK